MSTKPLSVLRLERVASGAGQRRSEVLEFESGVNVVVGSPNTGKTKWLDLLDFLLGDGDTPSEALDEVLLEKYRSASVQVQMGDSPFEIERKWHESGGRSKIIVNGVAISAAEFSELMLDQLGTKAFRFPQGDPHSGRTWPRLSWRMLLRHIYRREWSWMEIAAKQPESEQHACLMHFLGLGNELFPDAYAELVDQERHVVSLRARKEQFLASLHEVTTEVARFQELSVAVTPVSIEETRRRLQAELANLDLRRGEVLENLADRTISKLVAKEARASFDAASTKMLDLRQSRQEVSEIRSKSEIRLKDLGTHLEAVRREVSRLRRARVAGDAFADLKVTHCPVCDRAVQPEVDPAICYLCRRPHGTGDQNTRASEERLAFELEQLGQEEAELQQLVDKQAQETRALARVQAVYQEQIDALEVALQPPRSTAALLVPEEVTAIDRQRGAIEEQSRQLDRIASALQQQQLLSTGIDDIARKVERLEKEVEIRRGGAELEGAGDILSNAMNDYFNAINRDGVQRWPEGPVTIRIRDRAVRFLIGGEPWSRKLGATLKCYFLCAYQYALLSLLPRESAQFPGVCILDFPPTLADGARISDSENYLIEPFLRLLRGPGYERGQLIVAGQAFEGLKAKKRHQLSTIWR